MIEDGRPAPLGARYDGQGVNFALYSAGAERVELCLFDADERESARLELPGHSDGIWHGYIAGCRPGQLYGYRVYGRYDPAHGLRFNAAKLLIDPYTRQLRGSFRWSPEVFDFRPGATPVRISTADSAPFVPKCVVSTDPSPGMRVGSRVPWPETIIYEANVRGYTMRHPQVPEADRGMFRGMKNGSILSYLKALGITSVELMPVQEFIDEESLCRRGLRNLWGYNTVAYFVPAGRYTGGNPHDEFRDMVDAIHDAGLEVIMDVAYNHTGESDTFGPTLSFRGIDNLSYYRTRPGEPGVYVNDTGCGNTINVDNPQVRMLIRDSLRYWAECFGIDGFRFDLAAALGRGPGGFDSRHSMFRLIAGDDVLSKVKLIAEPWDIGPGGYRLGAFPARWAEWNDRYRDSVRRFWRGDREEAAEFARRIHGSADFFEASGRTPSSSVNFVAAHDGFTLADVVTYESRHNEANGEANRDGHAQNFSRNFGVEGPTEDPDINALRRRQRLNMLMTLLLSHGTPMLLAGDEFGNSQHGNNNAYAQDNETGWLDWSALAADPEFHRTVTDIVRLRRNTDLLRDDRYRHGRSANRFGWRDIEWLRPDGRSLGHDDWPHTVSLSILLASAAAAPSDGVHAVALSLNREDREREFVLPHPGDVGHWRFVAASGDTTVTAPSRWRLAPLSALCCCLRIDGKEDRSG